MKVAIVGYGVVGKAYGKVFPEAVIYDPFNKTDSWIDEHGNKTKACETTQEQVNECDVALVAVFTPHNEDGTLDISIVEEVVGWIDCNLIIIKSALQPGTTDKLIEKTGKRIAISVEYIGEGNYFVPSHKYPDTRNPKKHQLLVVGGAEDVAEQACEVLWDRLSPDVRIHKVTALEAEIVKLTENTYGALKVTFGNVVRDICDHFGVSFIRVHQAWTEDGRVDPMHTKSVSHKRGWQSKCYDKDIPAFASLTNSKMIEGLMQDNERHLKLNEK